jgi:hypothetical protein
MMGKDMAKFPRRKFSRPAAVLGGVALLCALGTFAFWEIRSAAAAEMPKTASADNLKLFDQQVKPFLAANCIKCHGGETKIKGGLRLTSRDSVLKGGDDGAVVSLDAPDKSLLLAAINYGGEIKMPPDSKLPPDKIELLTKWVKAGVPWTAGVDLTPAVLAETPASGRPDPPTPEAARKSFWAFQPVKRPPLPAVKDSAWVRNPVDAFILAKLEAKGFKPAPPADKVSLIRRATYDLTGLPPTPAEIDAFVADQSTNAYEKVIDRLLASPHYGEKWGRYWLDLVRYGESNSYERDNPKPNVWRYRDYVIRSFNDDKPYDRFVKEQLAGDEMPDAASSYDPIIATGFYRLGIWDDEPNDRLQARYDGLDDIVTTTGQVFMGLTIDCARCHNHKIDPILQTDYYRLLAFFQNIRPFENGGAGDQTEIFDMPGGRQAYDAQVASKKQQVAATEARIIEIASDFIAKYPAQAAIYAKLTTERERKRKREEVAYGRLIFDEGELALGHKESEEYRKLRRELDEEKHPPDHARALCVSENGATAADTYVCLRGNANVPGEIVHPGFPKVLADGDAVIPKPAPGAKTTGRRTVLANWITSDADPLFTRVMVNRIFQYHFGRGIVRSPNNFGVQGDRPTHPELLDWLASEFKADGLHLKPIHKLLMMSNAYQMSSAVDEKALAEDPQNNLFWRFDLRRLTAEEVRDSILAVDGSLNTKMYGPSIYPFISRGVMAGQTHPGEDWHTTGTDEDNRRSIYVHIKRSLPVPILQAFDAAETDRSCPVRFATVQPTQALGMLNGTFLNEEAQKLADRLKREAGDDLTKQVTLAFRLTTGRVPTQPEISRCLDMMAAMQKHDGATPEQARKYYCLMMLNLNEFMFLD